jgi:hypothetical protein
LRKKNRGNRRKFSRLEKTEGDVCLRTREAENTEEHRREI